uniref:BZ1 n=1 Tax=Arundo donax TaxID=35708 RepID=A0A0A8YCE4_ARUDO
MEPAVERNESVAPAGAAAAARARAKERSTAAWELKGNATTATCGGKE